MNKKFLSICALCAFALITAISFLGCNKDDSLSSEQAFSENENYIPKGYSVYDNGTISFVHPENWQKSGESIIYINDVSGTGNNITVVCEEETEMYINLTEDSFDDVIGSVFSEAGMSVSDVFFENTQNEFGTNITGISFTATYLGSSVYQTMYCVNAGGNTFVVTLTEMKRGAELSQNLFNSLRVNVE